MHNFSNSIVGALIVWATVIWQVKVGNADVKMDIKAVDEKVKAFDMKVDAVRMECQHVQSIALGSAYAAMKAISGDRTLMNGHRKMCGVRWQGLLCRQRYRGGLQSNLYISIAPGPGPARLVVGPP